MTCGACRGLKEKSFKCLLSALDSIKAHALMMQRDAEESAKTIRTLQAHNKKLHLALDLLKERQESGNQAEKRRRVSPKKRRNEDTSPLSQGQSSLDMNIAINSIDMSDEEAEMDPDMDEDETIAETESTASPRKLRLPNQRQPDIRNLENLQPNSLARGSQNWFSKTPKNAGVLTKLSLTHKLGNSNLKQTRLKFEANKSNGSEKDVIEDSPNISAKRSRPSRTLMQSNAAATVSSAGDANLSKMAQHLFEMEDDPRPDPPVSPPRLKFNETSDSVVLLTPATQDIIFVNDSPPDVSKMGTMDVLAEVMKEDDDACSSALRQYERIMIDQQKNTKPQDEPDVPSTQLIKEEPISQPEAGNESTKMPEDIEKYLMEDGGELEEEFPQPIAIKQEAKQSLKEQYNIECEECEKFINFMGSNLTDEKIKSYLSNCRHVDPRSSTPPGFWNPHMVSFAEDDPRNQVLIDNRFRLKK
ncbi:hypothetical protein KR018_011070 [Drosophila ironensis]|nr:hypothetical protein KR018_011070 [Drosophila ironensis]